MSTEQKKTPTIDDLDWIPHPSGLGGEQARIDFDNGYGLSVLRGGSGTWYTRDGTYEVAVMKDGDVCYSTPITEDVLGYVSAEVVNDVIQRVMELEA